ncbi:MAG: twin-arginine translocation signal domain-containing protein [Krumholzibacteria bacterium]|nr:twin-arginine translocation signal domain-containing protein [Candidatus Krumholzibacteria bacterium]
MTYATTRREFLRTAALTGAAVGLSGVASPLVGWARAADAAPDRLKVLILGGTGQTGPHLVQALLDRGHAVTLFNRGNRSDELFPGVECLVGDRDPEAADGLKALEEVLAGGRTWDLAIDIWPHIPKIVERTAVLLQPAVGHFMYVSSISVYTDFSQPGGDETTPVGEAPNADELEYTGELFGPFKAECENRVRRIYPDNHTIFRPGLIVGPRDFSFRGGYWPVRVRKGGEVLAPGDGSDPIQIIDGRDLTAFQVRCMERRTGGTFNVTGPHPEQPLTMKGLLESCKEATGSDATFVWADNAFLEEQEIGAWMDMPCWIPAEGDYAGFGSRGIGRAVAAGLTFRPLVDTVRDTLAWYDELPEDRREGVTKRAGLSAEREAAALAAWHAAKG